jgi:hypothetical protein
MELWWYCQHVCKGCARVLLHDLRYMNTPMSNNANMYAKGVHACTCAAA